jgi:cytidylate kinase
MARNLEVIVEEQVQRWNELRREQDRPRERTGKAEAPPCVTISPEMGSLGLTVARRVSELLGFQVYERELVELIAQTARVRQYLVESVDQHVQSAIENWVGRQLGTAFFAESDYVKNLSKVLLILAHHGKSVIVGRGAQFVLEPGRTLRLRIVAPVELRVQRIAEREKIDLRAARAKVLRLDADRNAFVRKHFDRDLGDPNNYDLVLNTERLDVEACADLVLAAYQNRFGRR